MFLFKILPFALVMTLSQQEQQTLCQAAENAAKSAYSPYSKFRVGAAILGGQKIYVGTNIENASFGLILCAERAEFAHAIANGEREFKAIAIACIDGKNINNLNTMSSQKGKSVTFQLGIVC